MQIQQQHTRAMGPINNTINAFLVGQAANFLYRKNLPLCARYMRHGNNLRTGRNAIGYALQGFGSSRGGAKHLYHNTIYPAACKPGGRIAYMLVVGKYYLIALLQG
jgi:hypothetical protein